MRASLIAITVVLFLCVAAMPIGGQPDTRDEGSEIVVEPESGRGAEFHLVMSDGFDINGTRSLACPPKATHSNATAGGTDPVAPEGPGSVDTPSIVRLYPNPTSHGNVGEFALLALPADTNVGTLTLTDGHTTAGLPNETVTGRVAVSMDPDVSEEWTTYPVLELDGHLRLSAEGDDLELRENDTTIDAVSYDRAPQANVWYRTAHGATDGTESGPALVGERVDGDGIWWPREATCFPPSTVTSATAETFVQPDSPEVPLELFRTAEDRLYLAGYTLTSEAVAAELHDANDRGVEVVVLVDGGPVGGTAEETDEILTGLEAAGVTVRALGGEGARYAFHHPKYAVVDGSVLVTTENWNPSGVGGTSSRGWGITVRDDDLADDLATTFQADLEGWDARAWSDHRADVTFVEDDSPTEPFPSEHDPSVVSVSAVELLLAPDNAEGRLLQLIDDAEESILLKQARIPDPGFPLLEATVAAARDGVDVRILLDSTWYVEAENRETAAALDELAADEGLPLEVALVEPGSGFEKIHAKGMVIDEEVSVVGSANWNDNAFRNNREVLLAVHGEDAASFYVDVFDNDWDGESWSLPLEFVVTLAVGVVVALFLGNRHVRFGSRDEPFDTRKR